MSPMDDVVSGHHRDARIKCPECGDNRKKKNVKTLSITVLPDKTLYHCHHCGISGLVKKKPFYEEYMKNKEKVVSIPTQLNYNVNLITEFFERRGVTLFGLDDLPAMTTGMRRFGGEEKEAIGFVYGSRENPSAIKWRSIDGKNFICEGAPRSFYGIEALDEDADDLIVVEGEADVIALGSLSIRAVSCPNGAPIKVSNNRVSPEEDNKFAYVWEERERIEKAKRVILAVDNDEAGEALAEELARRVGRAKCWRVKFPDGTKDANDALEKLGATETRRLIDNPEPVPLSGVYGASDYLDQVKNIYQNGHGKGASTGFKCVDDIFTIAVGQLSVITGMPGSGKSEFIDQIMMNLAERESWKFAVCSFENPVPFHIAKLAEKRCRRSFYDTLDGRMSVDELEGATDFINKHFVFLESRDGALSTIDSILDRLKQSVMRLGVRGCVIDPYNMIEHTSPEEHTSISHMLSKITQFAKAFDCHIFFVAHPSKMYANREDGSFSIPKGQNISGSASWHAKCDLGITVHRTPDDEVEIHCWKSRFKWVGQQGVAILNYNMSTGTYEERGLQEARPSSISKLRGQQWSGFDDL